MEINRRQFLKLTGVSAAATAAYLFVDDEATLAEDLSLGPAPPPLAERTTRTEMGVGGATPAPGWPTKIRSKTF